MGYRIDNRTDWCWVCGVVNIKDNKDVIEMDGYKFCSKKCHCRQLAFKHHTAPKSEKDDIEQQLTAYGYYVGQKNFDWSKKCVLDN